MIGKGRYFDPITRIKELVCDPTLSNGTMLDKINLVLEKYHKISEHSDKINEVGR